MKELRPPELPRRVFSPIAAAYDRPAITLSLFQYRRWHRFLLSCLDLAPRNERSKVLDMATGTGMLARELLKRPDIDVVGGDVTHEMLLQAQMHRRSPDGCPRLLLVECTAESPPFAPESFDAVAFAYLLRYVSDVPSTLRTLAALLKPGGTMASLDFSVPEGIHYLPWRLYTGVALPLAGRLWSREWMRVNAFLGWSIREFNRRWPENRLLDAWRQAGLTGVSSRRLSFGAAMVVWGRKER